MFEYEIQFYCSRGAALADDHASVSLAEISASGLLPDAVKCYFRAEALWLLKEERAAVAGSRFDYEKPEARLLASQLDAALAPTAIFSADEYLDTLERAVKLTFNYLCRPQLTLRSFVFRGAESTGVAEALLRIDYFHDYAYFRDVLRPWLERKQLSREQDITSKAFAAALAKIDQQVIQAMTVQDLHTLLQPMLRWIADAQPSPSDRIATDAYIIFFDDKNIGRIADYFSDVASRLPTLSTQQACIMIEELIQSTEPDNSATMMENNIQGTTIAADAESDEEEDDTVSIVTSELLPSVPSVPSVPFVSEEVPESNFSFPERVPEQRESEIESQQEPLSPNVDVSVADESVIVTDADEQPDEPSTLLEEELPPAPIEQVDISPPPPPTAVVAEPIVDLSPAREIVIPRAKRRTEAPQGATLGAMMSQARYSDRSSEFKILGARSAPAAPLADLRTLIDDDARKKFIKKLFRRNDPEYERALDALNAIQTWKEASAYIDSLFLRHGVDPYAKPAISFTDAVYSRFVRVPSQGRT